MQFTNQFAVEAPIDEVYEALLNPERVAPAMPGAEVLEKLSDDLYKVAIKIKLGPMTMTYRGEVEIADKNPGDHSASMKVKAKEARGQGSANATVGMACEESGGATQVTMTSDVQLSGKAAAMGRGIIEDVSSRLVDTFASNLAAELGSGRDAAVEGKTASAEAVPERPPSQPSSPKVGAGAGADRPPSSDEGLDALSLGAGMVAERMRDPRVLGVVVGGALALGYLIGRRGA